MIEAVWILLLVCVSIVIIGCLVTGPMLLGAWVLRPLDRAAKTHRCPTQFTIADFLCLFFLMQLAMAAVHSGMSYEAESVAIWVFDVFAWVSCAWMWLLSVRKLSRAGVRRGWHRAIFLALVLPVAFFGSIAAVVLALWLYGLLFSNVGPERISTIALLWASEIALIVGLYVCGRFVRRMVAAASPPTAEVSPLASEDDADQQARE